MKSFLSIVGSLALVGAAIAQEADPQPANAPPTAKPIEAGDWASYNYNANGWRYNDAEETLNSNNAKNLELKWKAALAVETSPSSV